MQIKTLLQPLEPPAGGLQQLQQNLLAAEKPIPQVSSKWRQVRWQTVVVLSLFAIGWHLLTPDVQEAPALVLFQAATTKPSTVVVLPGKNAQVKMYWQFEQR